MTEERTDEMKIEGAQTERVGFRIKQTEGEINPPLANAKEEPPAEDVIGKKIGSGKIPISSAIIKPPLRFEGFLLAETTGYPGWIYTEEDLEEIANLILECGWELSPKLQIITALVGLHGAKFAGYINWRKHGRPGNLRPGTGELQKEERTGEEVKT